MYIHSSSSCDVFPLSQKNCFDGLSTTFYRSIKIENSLSSDLCISQPTSFAVDIDSWSKSKRREKTHVKLPAIDMHRDRVSRSRSFPFPALPVPGLSRSRSFPLPAFPAPGLSRSRSFPGVEMFYEVRILFWST